MNQEKRNHVVVLPFPIQSHVNPLVAVARLLAQQRPGSFRFTVIVTPDLAPSSASLLHDCISYKAIATEHDASIASFLPGRLAAMKSMRAGFEEYLQAQAMAACASGEGGGGGRGEAGEGVISCILSDTFVTWGQEVATKFGIPRLVVFTTNAHTFAAYLQTPSLHSEGLLPLTDLELRVDIGPGFSIRGKDLPLSMKQRPEFVIDQLKDIRDAAGVIFNTVEAFERKPVEAIEKELATVLLYPIGPLLLMSGSPVGGYADGQLPTTVSLWAADRSCLGWLDGRLPGSVLYVSFGSLAAMEAQQMRELAEGLDSSGHDFLWVVRPGHDQGNHNVDTITLPAGFQERTKGRGLIIPWAPQLEVLSHASLGGFLTHCGWNSITENLSLGGLPMICWPQVAEQRLNARLLVDEWKVGLELQEGPDQLVSRAVVERAVRDLMQGKVGKEMKRRALELKQAACSAVQRGGSSYRHLESLVNEIASSKRKTIKLQNCSS